MSYGFYLADINDFDDLADWLVDHIKETYILLDLGKAPQSTIGEVKEIMKDVLKDEIDE